MMVNCSGIQDALRIEIPAADGCCVGLRCGCTMRCTWKSLFSFTFSDASISYVLTIGFLLDDIKTPNKIFGTDLARAVAGFSRGW